MNRLFEKYPFLCSKKFLAALYAVVVTAATLHRLWLGESSLNNFTIFRWSFFNLAHGNDLYAYHPDQYNDLFKYSPTFAFFMAPFWWLPKAAGLFAWNFINAFVPFFAVQRLKITDRAKAFILLFAGIELLGSIQNCQSNGLMAGLIIFAYAMMEEQKMWQSALFLCLGFYVKIFAVVAGIFFLFSERKMQFLAWGILIFAALGLLPASVCGFGGLITQYKSWFHLIANDPAHELNYSFMTLTQRWFSFTAPDSVYLVPGMILLLLPLVRKKMWKEDNFRLLLLASVLLWVVIFNHKAESPTYVIAVFGAGIFGAAEKPSVPRTFLLWFVFILTVLAATDLMPPFVRDEIIKPYCLKALPCIVLWLVVQWKLLRQDFSAA
ncbi:MAG TPA: glycosyltransferase family 87 protein [Bacteroidia bacterium]|nr:glycosyltransferase family 87 protein [Bacteroidia bacterium]